LKPAVLYQDDWVTLTFDRATGLVRYARSTKPYEQLADLDRSFKAIGAVTMPVGTGLKLLVDVRLAPPRNDAGFESKTNAALDGFLKRFARHATLMSTAVGKLQAVRLARARGSEARVFDDEQEALDYLEAREK
jgi:hypothetical protein